jgi:hypothetical protein
MEKIDYKEYHMNLISLFELHWWWKPWVKLEERTHKAVQMAMEVFN